VVELEIQNVKKHGQIKVFKTDGQTKTPLEGVVFEVFDSNGDIAATLTTDKDGVAVTDWLDYGDYTVREKTAKEGYILDETVHEIQIREHEKVYELELTNDKLPAPPETPNPGNPKTGDESNMTLWLLLAGASAAALVGLGVWGKRRKAKETK
jgi:uncharacterized surface anchored protein